MCTEPKWIVNPKLKSKHSAFNAAVDPLYLKVPCGKCRQCQIHRQQDILTRLAYEYEYTIKQGGWVLMDTLTYREEDVPRWHGLLCFDREHYTSFMKKLRVYLVRHYEEQAMKMEDAQKFFNEPYQWYIEPKYEYKPEVYKTKREQEEEVTDQKATINDGDIMSFDIKIDYKSPLYPTMHPRGKVKVFFVCEYGGEYSRPHYHILIFVTMQGITPIQFREYIRKAWIYGFTDKRHISKMLIHDFSGCAYVSKYVCKDIEWVKTITQQKGSSFMNYFEKRWKELYQEEFNRETLMKMPCETIKKLLVDIGMKDAIPFNSWSHNLGIYAMNRIEQKDLELGTMTIRDPKRGFKRVNIPDYLKRKYMYDYEKEIKYWKLNDTGKLIKAINQAHQKQRIIINLDQIMKQVKVDGINNDYKERMYDLVYTNKNKYNELLMTLINRDKLITREIRKHLEKGETWEEITAEEYMNNIEDVSLTSIHESHSWIYYTLKKRQQKYLQMVSATSEEVAQLIKIYDKGQEQIAKETERRLLTKWRQERLQKNRAIGGSINI